MQIKISDMVRETPRDCTIRCNKFLLLLFNAFFFGTGIILAVTGIWCLAGAGRNVIEAIVPHPELMPTLNILTNCLVGAGVLVLFTSLLGTWATLAENGCGLALYIILVVVVIMGEIAVGVFAGIHQNRALEDLTNNLLGRLQNHYGMAEFERFTLAIDYVQYQLQCCGIENHEDWSNSKWRIQAAGGDDWEVPLTCCRLYSSSQAHINPQPLNMTLCQKIRPNQIALGRYKDGCARRIANWIQAEMGLIVGITAAIALLEIGGIIAASTLCRRVRWIHATSTKRPNSRHSSELYWQPPEKTSATCHSEPEASNSHVVGTISEPCAKCIANPNIPKDMRPHTVRRKYWLQKDFNISTRKK